MHVVDQQEVEPGRIESLVRLQGARVLEIGCGEGRLTGFAASRAESVYAFDPDGEQVETARATLSSAEARRVRFAVHGLEALDVERERFDVALCGWSLWCVPPERVVDALSRIHTALVPGGVLVDTQPVGLRLPVRVERELVGELVEDEWLETVAAVDACVEEVIDARLFEFRHEERYSILHGFGSGSEALAEAATWAGTRIPEDVAERLEVTGGWVEIELEIRLRLLVRRWSIHGAEGEAGRRRVI